MALVKALSGSTQFVAKRFFNRIEEFHLLGEHPKVFGILEVGFSENLLHQSIHIVVHRDSLCTCCAGNCSSSRIGIPSGDCCHRSLKLCLRLRVELEVAGCGTAGKRRLKRLPETTPSKRSLRVVGC